MASLGEMLQYADYMSEINNPLAGIIQSGVSGYVAGVEKKRQKKKEDLDVFIKMIDLQDKMAKNQRENQQTEIQANMAKSFGFLPMNEDEKSVAEVQGFQNLGADKIKSMDNSVNGKLSQIFDTYDKKGYEVNPNYNSRNGFGFTMKRKQKEKDPNSINPSDRIVLQEKIRAQAQKMALTETMQKLGKTWDPIDKGSPLNATTAAPYVTEDIINKYLKPAELFLTGKQVEYQKVLEEILKKMKNENDPLGLGLK